MLFSHPTASQRTRTDLPDVITTSFPMDDEDFLHIATLFISRLHKQIDKMAAACDADDFDELHELGHWLKGAGGSAGFEIFSASGERLEDCATSMDTAQAKQQIDEIRELARRVRI